MKLFFETIPDTSLEVINEAFEMAIIGAGYNPIIEENKMYVDSNDRRISHSTLFNDFSGNNNLISIGRFYSYSPVVNRSFVSNIDIPLYIPKGAVIIDPMIPTYEKVTRHSSKRGNVETDDMKPGIIKLIYSIAGELYNHGYSKGTANLMFAFNENRIYPILDYSTVEILIKKVVDLKEEDFGTFISLVNQCSKKRKFFYHDACELDYATEKKPLQNKIELEYSIKSITRAIKSLIDNNQKITQKSVSELSGRSTSTVKRLFDVCGAEVVKANKVKNSIDNAIKYLVDNDITTTQINIAACMNISIITVKRKYSLVFIKKAVSLYKLASYRLKSII